MDRLLTARECQILQLAAEGWQTKQIGRALGLSPKTIKNHLRIIYSKLWARNRPHAAAIAFARGEIA